MRLCPVYGKEILINVGKKNAKIVGYIIFIDRSVLTIYCNDLKYSPKNEIGICVESPTGLTL